MGQQIGHYVNVSSPETRPIPFESNEEKRKTRKMRNQREEEEKKNKITKNVYNC